MNTIKLIVFLILVLVFCVKCATDFVLMYHPDTNQVIRCEYDQWGKGGFVASIELNRCLKAYGDLGYKRTTP
jgi:hypothetical protein